MKIESVGVCDYEHSEKVIKPKWKIKKQDGEVENSKTNIQVNHHQFSSNS